MCMLPRLLITSGMMWHGMNPIMIGNFYIPVAVVIHIISGLGLGRSQHNRTKLALH